MSRSDHYLPQKQLSMWHQEMAGVMITSVPEGRMERPEESRDDHADMVRPHTHTHIERDFMEMTYSYRRLSHVRNQFHL